LAFATFLVGGYGMALAALALVVFGATECPPYIKQCKIKQSALVIFLMEEGTEKIFGYLYF